MDIEALLRDALIPLPGEGDAAFCEAMAGPFADAPETLAALSTVAAVSPHLKFLMMGDPAGTVAVLARPLSQTVEDAVVPPSADLASVGIALRRAKARVSIAVALADLLAGVDVARVTAALSRTADVAIRTALASALLEAGRKGVAPDPDACGIIILALGKLGGEELNYSSDVDLVALYDPDRAEMAGIDGARAVRLVQTVTRLMQERTAEGYVFRVDLRLRPDPGATPVAVSTRAAIAYFQGRARGWERQAMIKARQVAGDRAAGHAYLRALEPTVWRLAYDFTVIDDTLAMREQIAAVRGAGALTVPGHNVKLGRGGIREIEFVVQSLQRIAGGRDRRLRGRSTVEMLAALAAAGWLDGAARDELASAYETLRRVEHRVQMVADEQTHELPGRAGLARIAVMMRDDAFEDHVRATFETVHRHFTALGDVVGQANPLLAPVSGAHATPARVIEAFDRAVDGWSDGRYAALRSERARSLLRALRSDVCAAIAASADPEQALEAFDVFLGRLPAGVELLARLEAHRELIPVLILIIAAAPRMAAELARRTHLLDVLIDPQFFGALPTMEALDEQLTTAIADAPDYEARLDVMRTFGQEQALLIDVRVLTGSLAGAEAGRATAALADVIVGRALTVARSGFEERHGRLANGAVTLVALGKFGSREMTATSDLDMVFVYDCAADAGESDGARPLSPGHYYTRLAQRFIAALSAPTARGTLYEVDLRLRPSGRAGPLATHIRSFTRYHEDSAWTWEHMALTRARVAAGEADLGRRVLRVIGAALERDRGDDRIGAEAAEMRSRMAEQSRAGLKLMPGGQVDIEFIAQVLQLRHGLTSLPDATGTQAALSRAAAAGALAPGASEMLRGAHALYQRLSQLLSIASDGTLAIEDAPAALQRLLVRAGEAPDVAFLVADITERAGKVRDAFVALVGPVD